MVNHQEILMLGELLRKNQNRYLTLKQVQDLLIDNSNSFHKQTIRRYMEVLVQHGYIKSVVISGVPMWEILK